MTIRTSAKQAALRLKALGFTVQSASEPERDHDGEIVITDRIHVQVGYDYLNVVKQHGDGDECSFEFFEAAATYEELASDLRAALAT